MMFSFNVLQSVFRSAPIAIVAAAVVFASAPPVHAQSFGFASFSAVISSNGTTVRGSGVQSSTRNNTGRYTIEFTRDVKKCAYVASPLGKNGGQASVRTFPGDKSKLRVSTYSKSGQLTNLNFVLLVSCSS